MGVFDGNFNYVMSLYLLTNAPGAVYPSATPIVDSTGLLHVLMAIDLGLGSQLFYQQFTAANALGNFHLFAVGVPGGGGTPCIVGNQLVFPARIYASGIQSFLLGTGLSNPTWALSSNINGIDSGTGLANNADGPPNFVYDPVNNIVHALWVGTYDGTTYQFRHAHISGSADLNSDWTDETITDLVNNLATAPRFYAYTWHSLMLTSLVPNLGPCYFVLPKPPPPVITAPISGAGGGAMGMGGLPGGFGGFGLGQGTTRFKCCSGGHQFQNVRALEVVRQRVKEQSAWPYMHEFPPKNSIPVQAIAYIPSPVLNTVAVVLQYLVPEGFRFYLKAILQDFEGASIDVANALWTIDRDAQVSNVQGAPVQGFSQIPIPLGSVARGERWKLPRAYEFGALTLLRSTVVNQTLGVGLPNSFVSGFFGYLVPATHS